MLSVHSTSLLYLGYALANNFRRISFLIKTKNPNSLPRNGVFGNLPYRCLPKGSVARLEDGLPYQFVMD